MILKGNNFIDNNLKPLIDSLKNDFEKVHRFEESGELFGLLTLGRGENLFFQKGDKAFICDISARDSELDKSSIKKWDDGTKISLNQKKELAVKISDLYKKFYKDQLKIE